MQLFLILLRLSMYNAKVVIRVRYLTLLKGTIG